jgi:hypothetical protein
MSRKTLCMMFVVSMFFAFTGTKANTKNTKNLIRNPDFSELIERKYKDGTIYKCPKHWEYAGYALTKKQNKIIPKENGNNVWYKTVIYTGVRPSKLENAEYIITVRAKGTGKIQVRTWSWKGYSPRTDHRRLDLGEFKLTDKFKDYEFKCKIIPGEEYIIFYIYGKDITLSKVSCIAESIKENEESK